MDHLNDNERALAMAPEFANTVISHLPMDEDFVLTDETVEGAISMIDIRRMKKA